MRIQCSVKSVTVDWAVDTERGSEWKWTQKRKGELDRGEGVRRARNMYMEVNGKLLLCYSIM